MNFSTDDDDGDFGFAPGGGGGSKLSSLFGMDKTSNQGGNESLTFTAPKQPKKSKDQQQPQNQGGQSALLLAVAVHAYRFSNGTYIKHGKLGAAILGNHTANDYKILLYISKQQQVTHARISPTFAFTVQANNYATFYDEQRQNWSIMFESEQNAIDFAKQVGLAKVNSAGGVAKALVFQDLTIGLGDAVQSGDSVEVKYTGWLYSTRSFGDVFDSNTSVDKPFRFKIGKGKVIKGWEEGVVGMKKNGRRLLIVPPALAYGKKGLGSRIPPNSTLLFDVEIKKLKFSREKEESGSLSSDATDGMRSEERVGSPKIGRSKDPSSDNESRIKHNNNSESQLSTSPSSSKAKLISRMAKMGQPMLPLSGALVGHDSTDSEADEASASSDTGTGLSSPGHQGMPKKAMKVPKKVHNNHSGQNSFGTDMGHGMHGGMPRPGDPSVHGGHQVAIYSPQAAHNQAQQMPGSQAHMAHQAQAASMGMQHGQGPMQNYPMQQQQQPPQQPPPPQPQAQPQQQQQHTYYQPPQHIPPQNPGQTPLPHHHHHHQMGGYPSLGAPGPQQALVTPQQMADMQMVPLVLTEARQHHSDIRTAVGKVSDRIEDLCKKVNDIQASPSPSLLSSSTSNQSSMEASVLMTNIQRIVQENERLKKEVYDKNSRIEKQNDKISELLQKNQLFVEQSNSLMEKTNDSFKLTATQSQQRVLELEQEKVHMTSELSNATSKISSLQMELSNVQQRESQLRAQLNGALSNSHENRGELDQLKQQLKENDNKYVEVLKSLKDERQLKKQLENRVTSLEEELSEMKMEKDNIEKNLVERKRKAAAEKQKSEEDVEDMKRVYEDEITQLKSKMRHQKSSTDAATAEQISQVERELETQWRERSDRLLLQSKEKHERELSDLKEEKEQLTRKLAATENKMITLRQNGENSDEVGNLKKKIEEMEVWKEKYESLHSSAVSMKERYETRIKELIQEKAEAAASSATIPQTNIVDEVKKVMNNVYHSLRGEIETNESYKGAEILNIIMNTIKVTMIKVVKSTAKKAGNEDDEEEDEESEEEDDEEEEDESEEEEEEEEVAVKTPPKKSAPKVEAAVPVKSAPPPGKSSEAPKAPVVEESIQRVEEQVVESVRQPEAAAAPLKDRESEEDEDEEADNGEEEEEEKKKEEEVAPTMQKTEASSPAIVTAIDGGSEGAEEDVKEEEKKEEQIAEVEAEPQDEKPELVSKVDTPVEQTEGSGQGREEEQVKEEQGGGGDMEDQADVDDEDDEDSQKDSKKDEDDDFWSAEEEDDEADVPVIHVEGPPELPPEPPQGPPQPAPPAHEQDEEEEQEEQRGGDAVALETGDKPRALSNIPDLPDGLDMGGNQEEEDEDDDEPDPFSPQDPPEDVEEEEEEEEEEEKEREKKVGGSAAPDPLPTVPDREPPELPPELPPEDDEDFSKKSKTKKEDISSGIFGDDDDDDNLFSIPVTKKKVEKKKPTPAKTTAKKTAEEDDPFKPGPPPPLFGDDNDDDLDWFS